MCWSVSYTQPGEPRSSKSLDNETSSQQALSQNPECTLWVQVFEATNPSVFDELEYRNTLIEG